MQIADVTSVCFSVWSKHCCPFCVQVANLIVLDDERIRYDTNWMLISAAISTLCHQIDPQLRVLPLHGAVNCTYTCAHR